jgi:hypothetical protein
MGQRVVFFSDLSGKEMKGDEKPAIILVEFSDKRRGIHLLEVLPEEAEDLAAKGTKCTRAELQEMGIVA